MTDQKIALTGGIATGKTTVANCFRDLGAIILDADLYARRAVEPGTASWRALRELLGPDYFKPDGVLKRRALREKILGDPGLRERLDSLLHPFILDAMWREWDAQRNLHPDAVIIFDIPLLFEGGFDKDFDLVVLVYTPREIQVQRLMERDRLDLVEAERTLAMQFPIERKKALSDYVIDNGVGLDNTVEQVKKIWKLLS